MKLDYLALIVLILIGLLVLIYPPFVASVYVPGLIRIPLLLLIVFFFVWLVSDRKRFVYKFTPYILFFFFELAYWALMGNEITGDTIYFVIFAMLGLSILTGAGRIKGVKILLTNFYLLLVVAFSVLSIASFLAFNFDLIPYTLKAVGEKEYYTNFHNPILGYVSVKKFETGSIGRVCGYFFEPSYLSWFLTVNFFLLKQLLSGSKNIFFIKIIVFLGALATCSTAGYLIFMIVLLIQFFYFLLNVFRINIRVANGVIILGILFSIIAFAAVIPKEKLLESLGTSSADDREDRIGTSFFILASSSVTDLLLGRSPGYIENTFQKGESNQIVKMVVELGLISTILILCFIFYCSKKSKYFMIANFLFLNSVVILFTPLFILNLIVCKWNEES